jgi:sirohydrochlorin cobaltochelatase
VTSGRDAVLVLVGHGSARHPESAAPIQALARSLAERRPWRSVRAAFMKQEPGLDGALDDIDAPVVVVVPVFAGKGYYTDTLIPKALGLDGRVTRRHGRTLVYTDPVGTHPRLPAILARRAEGAARSDGRDPRACSLLLIAHGSARPGGAGATPTVIAQAIRTQDRFAEVALAFLEQAPFAADWRTLVRGDDVVVLPLLVAQGMHASEDIPPLFAGVTDRRVRLAANLGAEPDLLEIIAEMAEAALA